LSFLAQRRCCSCSSGWKCRSGCQHATRRAGTLGVALLIQRGVIVARIIWIFPAASCRPAVSGGCARREGGIPKFRP